METISKTDEFKEKIEIIVKEFASDLKKRFSYWVLIV
jgi:hypothetical protein